MDPNHVAHSNQERLSVAEISKFLRIAGKTGERIDDLRAAAPLLPKIDKQAIRQKVEEKVKELSLEHPGWGPQKIMKAMKSLNVDLSPHAIYSILNKYQMATKQERLSILESLHYVNGHPLSGEQIGLLEKNSRSFRERHYRGARPGEVLAQDVIFIGIFKEVGEIYLQLVIDTYSRYAFGFLYINKSSDSAVSLLHNDALPFFKKLGFDVSTILTDNGREYCGKNNHHYELYLKLSGIEHGKIKTRGRGANSFIQQFIAAARSDFFCKLDRERGLTIGEIQGQFERWLQYYNRERPLEGCPDLSRPPLEIVDEFLKKGL